MSLSPVQRYKLKMAGQQSNAVRLNKQQVGSVGVETAQISVKLIHDLRRLKSFKSMKRKIAIKREILPAYDDYVAAVLEKSKQTGTAAENEIVATYFIWKLDVGDYCTALEIARHLLKYNLPLPDRFARDVASALVTEVTSAALYAVDLKQEFDPDILDQVADMTEGYDMSDDMRARLYKAQGLLCSNPEKALETLRAALDLSQTAGVKQQIRTLEKRVLQDSEKETGAKPAAGADRQNDKSSDIVVHTDPHPRKPKNRKYRRSE